MSQGNGSEASAIAEALRAAISIPVTITSQPVDLDGLTPADLDDLPVGFDLVMVVPESGRAKTDYAAVRFGRRGDVVVSNRASRDRIGILIPYGDRGIHATREVTERSIVMVRHDLTAESILGQDTSARRVPHVISYGKAPRLSAADRRMIRMNALSARPQEARI
ncbi:hypothetical protein [uncultured Enterovirga sp.]|uniref:hypothetical protein n=1 Tax=uncultured Enterovirga sp. TaxID=2026352 RepID=UPI0035CAE70F